MAPNVSLYFYAANDLNGAPLHVITDEDEYFKSLSLKLDLYGLGGGEFTLARKVGFAAFADGTFSSEVFVRVLVHAYSDTDFFTGFFLEKRDQVVVDVDEDGGEEFTFGGPGPKAYLQRAALRPESFTGADWALDLDNGVWHWNTTANWTGVMRRILLEDAAADAPALPDLSYTFTNGADSASNTPDDIGGADDFELPIGEDYLHCLWDLEDAVDQAVSVIALGTVASPVFRLDLFNSYGTDVGAGAFASGKVLLKEGFNIVNQSLELEGVALRKCSHVIVEGKDGTWATAVRSAWTAGDYVKIGKISYPRSSNTTILQRAGLRWLRRQQNGDQEITVEILPGHSDADGLYFPQDGPLALGNLIAVDTSADGTTHTPLDLDAANDQLVTGFELKLGEASNLATALEADRSWFINVKLNMERAGNGGSPDQASAVTGNTGSCHCPALCHAEVGGSTESLSEFLNANDPGGDLPHWVGLLSNQGGSADGANGTDWYMFKSGGSPDKYQTSLAASPGQTLRVTGWYGCRSKAHLTLAFGTAAPGTAGSTFSGTVIGTEEDLHPDGPGHTHADEWFSFTHDCVAPAGTNSYALGTTGSSGNNTDFDEIRVTVLGEPGQNVGNGTEVAAARCDHTHALDELRDVNAPTPADDDVLTWDATAGEWVAAAPTGGGGAGHTIKEDGTPLTARAGLNFGSGLVAADDAGNNETDVDLDWAEDADISTQAFGDAAATGTSQEVARAGHKHGMPANPVTTGAVIAVLDIAEDADISTQAFGDSPAAGASTSEVAMANHKHGMPANPVSVMLTRRAIEVILSGSGTVIPTATQVVVRVPWDCTIVRASALALQTGSLQVDVWKDTYANHIPTDADSITASAPIAISSSNKMEDATLTGWTTNLTRGDVLVFNVDSATTIQQATIILEVTV